MTQTDEDKLTETIEILRRLSADNQRILMDELRKLAADEQTLAEINESEKLNKY